MGEIMNRRIGVILSFVLIMVEGVLTFFLTPYIIRTLGQAEYGVYKLIVSINSYILLLDLGIGNAVIRYISKFRTNQDKIKEAKFLGIANIFYWIISAVAFAVGIIITILFPRLFSKGLTFDEIELSKKLLIVTVLNSVILFATTPYRNAILAYEKFGFSRTVSIVQITFRIGLSFISLRIGYGSIGIVIANLITTIISGMVLFLYAKNKLQLRANYHNMDFSMAREVVAFSLFVLLQMIATQINNSVDQILIGSLVVSSASLLGIYSLGIELLHYFEVVGRSFTNVLMPGLVRIVESGGDKSKIQHEMEKTGRIIFMSLIFILSCFAIVGQDFIKLWAGDGFQESYVVTLLLMSVQTITITEVVGSQVLWAMNQHKEQAVAKITIVLINIIFSIALIKWRPVLGAVIGTVISITIGDIVVMNVIYKKKLSFNVKHYFSEIFKGTIICILISSIVGVLLKQCLPSGWSSIVLPIVIMGIVYWLLMWKYGFNSVERDIVKSTMLRLKMAINK